MLYGSRERASGRQSTCVGNPLGAAPRKGLLSINPASPLLPEGLRGRVGRGAIATALLQEQLLGGCWDSGLAQVQPHRQKLQFFSVSFPSLLLPGTVLTASRHTWGTCWCAACQRNPGQGRSPVCRTAARQPQTGNGTHCSHPTEGAAVRAPCHIPLIFRDFPDAPQESPGVRDRRGCVAQPHGCKQWVRKATGASVCTARVRSSLPCSNCHAPRGAIQSVLVMW